MTDELRVDISDFFDVARDLIEYADHKVSDILPSAWYEANRIMTQDLSAMPGPFRYDWIPYAREIVDCLSPTHPASEIAVIKGAQLGLSTGVVEPGIGWIIDQQPGPILYLVGHQDLIKESMSKVDKMIDGTQLRHKIHSTTHRARNNKSGDTDKRKDFTGGWLRLDTTNYKSLRNFSVQYEFIDDYEAMKSATKEAGDTRALILKRASAFKGKRKIFYLSSPELKEGSNIEAVYLMGDQRRYHVPCPCCGEFIILEWSIPSEINPGEQAGITWALDDKGDLIPESVGYICQKCGDFFDDSNKMELLRAGQWIPTAKPVRPDFVSYHISSLYAPTFMDGWLEYVYQWLEANPPGEKPNAKKVQSFLNLALGQTYEPVAETISATELSKNINRYEIGIVPNKVSQEDGNGPIVLLTCAADLNGKEDDARLDYEVVAWSASGATYSVEHGSIGTFQPKGTRPKNYSDGTRIEWSYRHGLPNSVWPKFLEILQRKWPKDTGGTMPILASGLDTGYQQKHAFQFVDNSNIRTLYKLKGTPDTQYVRIDIDRRTFKKSREIPGLWLVESNVVKDQVADNMGLTYNPEYHEAQPAGFMNFPTPAGGKYLMQNYFMHFEAEHKKFDDKGRFTWMKKNDSVQNHQFDNRCYNVVAKDIFLHEVFKELKITNGSWIDYVKLATGK